MVLTEQKVAQSAPQKPGAGRGAKGGVREASRELGIERTDAQRATKVASLSGVTPVLPLPLHPCGLFF